MPRIDTAAREIAAEPERVYAAFLDPEQLVRWLPPRGMSGRLDRFDPVPGGGYRMVLSYDAVDPHSGTDPFPGKRGDGTDEVEGRFIELVPGARVVQEVDFVSDDPAFAGTMRMTWSVEPSEAGSRVSIRAEQVPSGISAAEHAVGFASSLQNLAAVLER